RVFKHDVGPAEILVGGELIGENDTTHSRGKCGTPGVAATGDGDAGARVLHVLAADLHPAIDAGEVTLGHIKCVQLHAVTGETAGRENGLGGFLGEDGDGGDGNPAFFGFLQYV